VLQEYPEMVVQQAEFNQLLESTRPRRLSAKACLMIAYHQLEHERQLRTATASTTKMHDRFEQG
jgi:hypothetical protein